MSLQDLARCSVIRCDQFLRSRDDLIQNPGPFVVHVSRGIVPVAQHRIAGRIRPEVMAVRGEMDLTRMQSQESAEILFVHGDSDFVRPLFIRLDTGIALSFGHDWRSAIPGIFRFGRPEWLEPGLNTRLSWIIGSTVTAWGALS